MFDQLGYGAKLALAFLKERKTVRGGQLLSLEVHVGFQVLMKSKLSPQMRRMMKLQVMFGPTVLRGHASMLG